MVDGIGYSHDKMLQGRLLSYPDAHRYRLGVNFEQIPVNRCPCMVANYQRDGMMTVNGNGEDAPNYDPNSFDDIEINQAYKKPPIQLDSTLVDSYYRNGANSNNYTQPGLLFTKTMNDYDRHNLVSNIVEAMNVIEGPKKDIIINRNCVISSELIQMNGSGKRAECGFRCGDADKEMFSIKYKPPINILHRGCSYHTYFTINLVHVLLLN